MNDEDLNYISKNFKKSVKNYEKFIEIKIKNIKYFLFVGKKIIILDDDYSCLYSSKKDIFENNSTLGGLETYNNDDPNIYLIINTWIDKNDFFF